MVWQNGTGQEIHPELQGVGGESATATGCFEGVSRPNATESLAGLRESRQQSVAIRLHAAAAVTHRRCCGATAERALCDQGSGRPRRRGRGRASRCRCVTGRRRRLRRRQPSGTAGSCLPHRLQSFCYSRRTSGRGAQDESLQPILRFHDTITYNAVGYEQDHFQRSVQCLRDQRFWADSLRNGCGRILPYIAPDVLQSVSVLPDVITYRAAISACVKGGQWQKSLGHLAQMRNVGVLPHVITYNAAICAWWKMSCVRVLPDVITYSALISACETGDQWQQALEIFEHILGARLQRHTVTYNAAISDCEKGNRGRFWKSSNKCWVHDCSETLSLTMLS